MLSFAARSFRPINKTLYFNASYRSINSLLTTFNRYSSITSTRKEKGITIQAQKARFNFQAFGGNPEVLHSLNDIVSYSKDPHRFKKLGIEMPKGILLSGPPGTGKTMFAEALAGELQLPFFTTSAPELKSMYVAETETNIRDFFSALNNNLPCVAFIDEIDAIAHKRFEIVNTGSQSHINSEINQLLTCLSEMNGDVVMIAATNNFNALDPAIIRPGRFDRHIIIPLPNRDDRLHILKIHTKNKELCSDISLEDLAEISNGFSGAKIKTWVNEAALCAIRDGESLIKSDHFDAAFTLLETGLVKSSKLTLKEKTIVAEREAAHILVGHLLGFAVRKSSLQTSGNSHGYTEWTKLDGSIHSKQRYLNIICRQLAGIAADNLLGMRYSGQELNIIEAKKMAIKIVDEEAMNGILSGFSVAGQVEQILNEQANRAHDIINHNRSAWKSLSDALIKYETLQRDDIHAILEGKEIKPKAKSQNKKSDSGRKAATFSKKILIFNSSCCYNGSRASP